MSVSVQDIADSLGVPPEEVGYLESLEAGARERLFTDLLDARRAHEAHIQSSMRKAFNHVPRLLRKPLRKLFGI